MANTYTVAPLYLEFVHVIVRTESEISKVSDLNGKRIALGPDGSGSRQIADRILSYLDVQPGSLKMTNSHFSDLAKSRELDGAIVVAGIQHPGLQELLRSRKFKLIPIELADAIEMKDPHLRQVTIPKGLYCNSPQIPNDDLVTLASPAFLITNLSTDTEVIRSCLYSLHQDNLRIEFPNLITKDKASGWITTRLHAASQEYFFPYDQLGLAQSVMESIVALKELLLAIVAAFYLIWRWWKNKKEQAAIQQFSEQKEYLDVLLEKTLSIQLALASQSQQQLEEQFNSVTQFKVEVLRKFTDERLRNDSTFNTFTMQCDNLLNLIQLRIQSNPGNSRNDADQSPVT